MTYNKFAADVQTMANSVAAIAGATAPCSFPDTDYSIDVCECVAEITGADVTLCRMFNRKFRMDAVEVSLEMAHKAVA